MASNQRWTDRFPRPIVEWGWQTSHHVHMPAWSICRFFVDAPPDLEGGNTGAVHTVAAKEEL